MRSADFMMIMLTLMLVIFGIIMVFSASYYWSINQFGQPYHFLIRDLFWAVTGFGWMFAAMIIDYHVLANKKIAVGAMIVSIILLALVLTPPCTEYQWCHKMDRRRAYNYNAGRGGKDMLDHLCFVVSFRKA